MKVYCSWRWLLGLFAMLAGLTIHIFMLQFLDLTLLAANAVTSIVAIVLFSTTILGEVFMWRYDLPGLLLIATGCTTVLNANKTETEYTATDVKELLKAPKTLCFMAFCVFCILLSVATLSVVLRRLRRFEADVESYEREHGLVGE